MANNILSLNHKEAKTFFIKADSYFSGEFSKYFHFTKILHNIYSIYEKYKDSVLRWKILSRKNLLPILEEQKYYQIWKGTFPEADKEYLKSPKINFRMKIGYILIRLRLDRGFKSLVQKWA